VKRRQKILSVNTESPILLSQPAFDNIDVPRNMHEKERLMSLSLLLILILILFFFYYYY